MGGLAPLLFLLLHSKEASSSESQAKPAPLGKDKAGHRLSKYFVADAVEAAAPAVVNIMVNVRFYGGRWAPTYATQSGSGFIISEDGLVVTNAHVVAHTTMDGNILVTLHDGRKIPAHVHSVDSRTDVALLKLETNGSKLPVCKIGQSSTLRPGEWVVALGSPQGLANTVTVGIVSAVARLGSELGLLHTRSEFIQTDAAINQGNSGGPLVNLDGEVVGINSMKLEYSDGIGFAIPIDIAWQVVQQLIKYKRVRRPYVGLAFRLVGVEAPDGHLLADGEAVEVGMLILEVKPGSPAEKGGLREGDVIIEFDGKKVKSLRDITDRIGLDPERTFRVKVIRQGSEKPLTLHVTSAVASDDRPLL